MKLQIISTTDGKFIGLEFNDKFPIKLGDIEFTPDSTPIQIGNKTWRFFNSNYSIDTKEV